MLLDFRSLLTILFYFLLKSSLPVEKKQREAVRFRKDRVLPSFFALFIHTLIDGFVNLIGFFVVFLVRIVLEEAKAMFSLPSRR